MISSLIEWWDEYYCKDVFAGIPDRMSGLIRERRLFASRSVKDEIKDDPNAKEKTLAQWCREQEGFYIEDTEEV